MHTKEDLYSLCNPHASAYIHIQLLIDLYHNRTYFTLSACIHSLTTPKTTPAETTPEVQTIWHKSFRQKIDTNLLDRNVLH